MWNGKNKAITFSFDDAVKQDIRTIEILNKYGLKATFNLNSAYLGTKNSLVRDGVNVCHDKVSCADVKSVYNGHEVAVHTLSHPNLTTLLDKDVIFQVEQDRKILSDLCGYEVVGMAYPCGGVNNDDRVAKLIKENTGVKYCRTITSTFDYLPQENLHRFNPSAYFVRDDAFALADKFFADQSEGDKVLYLWAHTYEFDYIKNMDWQKFEELCKYLSNKPSVFYGTNKEVLL